MKKKVRTLQERLERVGRERDALVERIQNLETIVTSEAWDALQAPMANAHSVPEEPDSAELAPPSEKKPARRPRKNKPKHWHGAFAREEIGGEAT